MGQSLIYAILFVFWLILIILVYLTVFLRETFFFKFKDGVEIWFQNGELHREDGPAIIYPDGTLFWYQKGKCHREDGPAVIWHDGTQEWFLNGELHREDGPAIIRPNGKQSWYLNGVRMTPMGVFEKLSDEQKEKALWNLNQWR